LPLKAITLERLEAVVAETDWTSPQVFSAAVAKLRTVLNAAVKRGHIPSNPALMLELPKRKEKKVDPFSKEEADRIIQYLYSTEHWPSLIFGAYFEFVFYTGMRLSEALALRWDEIDWHARTAYVCRTVALGKIEERTKTGKIRTVLLNDRAMHALE